MIHLIKFLMKPIDVSSNSKASDLVILCLRAIFERDFNQREVEILMKICRRLAAVPLSKETLAILDRALYRIDFDEINSGKKVAPINLKIIDLVCEMVKDKSIDEFIALDIQPQTAAHILRFSSFINMCKEGRDFGQVLKEVFISLQSDEAAKPFVIQDHLVDEFDVPMIASVDAKVYSIDQVESKSILK